MKYEQGQFRKRMSDLVRKVTQWETLLTSATDSSAALFLYPPKPPQNVQAYVIPPGTVVVHWEHPDGFALTAAEEFDEFMVTPLVEVAVRPPCRYRYVVSVHEEREYEDMIDKPLMNHFEPVGQTEPGAVTAVLSGLRPGAAYRLKVCVYVCVCAYVRLRILSSAGPLM